VLTAATSTSRSYHEETRGVVTLRQSNVTVTYMVGGATAEEIDWQMAILGPRDVLGGYSWYALTEPMFNWEYECACADLGCKPPAVTILLTIRYTIPHWSQPGMEHDPLVGYWNYFEQALRTHEQGHGELAAGCAWQLGDAITAQPAAATCAEFDASIPATDTVFQGCRSAQPTNEEETKHRESQGVAWPPGE
jgi:predicted secreted Zn-dependent protease